mgnify:FL=1
MRESVKHDDENAHLSLERTVERGIRSAHGARLAVRTEEGANGGETVRKIELGAHSSVDVKDDDALGTRAFRRLHNREGNRRMVPLVVAT